MKNIIKFIIDSKKTSEEKASMIETLMLEKKEHIYTYINNQSEETLKPPYKITF